MIDVLAHSVITYGRMMVSATLTCVDMLYEAHSMVEQHTTASAHVPPRATHTHMLAGTVPQPAIMHMCMPVSARSGARTHHVL